MGSIFIQKKVCTRHWTVQLYIIYFSLLHRMKFLVVAFLIGAASSSKISSKEDLIKRFGEKNVSFDPNVRTNYCNQCMEITVTSSGGTQEHQPARLGKYTVAGSLGRTWSLSGWPPT